VGGGAGIAGRVAPGGDGVHDAHRTAFWSRSRLGSSHRPPAAVPTATANLRLPPRSTPSEPQASDPWSWRYEAQGRAASAGRRREGHKEWKGHTKRSGRSRHPKELTSGSRPPLASWEPSGLLCSLGCIAIGGSASWLTIAGMSSMWGPGAAVRIPDSEQSCEQRHRDVHYWGLGQ